MTLGPLTASCRRSRRLSSTSCWYWDLGPCWDAGLPGTPAERLGFSLPALVVSLFLLLFLIA